MFKKAAAAAQDSRIADRRPARGVRAVLDGQYVSVLDISTGGLRLSLASPPRVAVLTIYENGAKTMETPAVLCWRRGNEAGYAFRRNLGVYQVEPSTRPSVQPAARRGGGSALRARLGF